MFESLMTKLFIFILFFAIFNVLREIKILWGCYKQMKEYEVSDKRLIALWTSLSYIFTIIFTGV